MEDKKQDVNSLEELVKAADSYRAFFANLADELAKVLGDIKTPNEEEDTWKMKCPYEYGDKHYCIQPTGEVFSDCWEGIEADNRYFSQGNIFPTEQAAELEANRRNLLTRFKAFRDECNGDRELDWDDFTQKKYYVFYSESKNDICVTYIVFDKRFHTFGYFKNGDDAYKAIELFGDKIKELFVECD